MRFLVASLSLSAVFSTQPASGQKDAKGLLDGVWIVEEVRRDPPEKVAGEGKGIRIVVVGAKATAYFPGSDVPKGVLQLKVDATKKPAQLDARAPGEAQSVLGVFAIEGDILRVCFAPLEGERPTDLTVAPGSRHTFVVLKRGKR